MIVLKYKWLKKWCYYLHKEGHIPVRFVGRVGRGDLTERQSAGGDVIKLYKKTLLFFECCFPYVCPEPVLVKSSFSV
jgi:hypothetical protein